MDRWGSWTFICSAPLSRPALKAGNRQRHVGGTSVSAAPETLRPGEDMRRGEDLRRIWSGKSSTVGTNRQRVGLIASSDVDCCLDELQSWPGGGEEHHPCRGGNGASGGDGGGELRSYCRVAGGVVCRPTSRPLEDTGRTVKISFIVGPKEKTKRVPLCQRETRR